MSELDKYKLEQLDKDINLIIENIEKLEKELVIINQFLNNQETKKNIKSRDTNNSIDYNGKKINFFSETESFHVDKKKFKTIGEILHQLWEDEVIDTLSYQAMLTVAMENVSDMPHEITKEYIEYLEKEAKAEPDNPMTKKRRDIEVAIALNHIQQDNTENGGGTSNPVESAEKGKEKGGNQEKKKVTAEVKINKEKAKEYYNNFR